MTRMKRMWHGSGAEFDAFDHSSTSQGEVYGYLTSKDGPLTGSPIKRAEGRSSKDDDPIATIALMADTAIFLYFDRRFSQTFRLERGAITRKNSKFVRFLKPQSKLNLLTQIKMNPILIYAKIVLKYLTSRKIINYFY